MGHGPRANTCLWIRRWATMNARGYDGPGLALANLPFIIQQGYIEVDARGRVMWVYQGHFGGPFGLYDLPSLNHGSCSPIPR